MGRRALWAALALLSLASCQQERAAVELPAAEGPRNFQPEIAFRHGAQFEGEELRERLAGSQQEQGAAVYILGVLQRNGYVVRLDGVPVRNLVTSTNVIATSPAQEGPEAIVVVPYDTAPGVVGDGHALGLFLELARALRVAAPDHGVSFAAVGAEHATGSDGGLGSRRLARLLLDEDEDPLVIRLLLVTAEGDVQVGGAAGDRIRALAPDRIRPAAPSPSRDAFAEAGFETAVVSGGVPEVGRILLRFLAGPED